MSAAGAAARRRVELLDLHPPSDDVLAEVLAGLSASPKTLPCKLFYDARGSELFDRICELPEYYLTRTEMAILAARAREMARAIGPQATVLEPGSGSSHKTRILLDHLADPIAYVPVDISREHLLRTARELAADYPDLEVLPVCADYTRAFELPSPRRPARRRVAFFPGSTIGNFDPPHAVDFLRVLRQAVGDGGGLLLGFDLKKASAVLERAYDDAAGVTAEFNLNLLRRLNRELGADFDLGAFRHRAVYDPEAGRIEMWLVSQRPQTVRVGDRRFDLAAGEGIHTESSYKSTLAEMERLAGAAGFLLEASWSDPQERFSLAFFSTPR